MEQSLTALSQGANRKDYLHALHMPVLSDMESLKYRPCYFPHPSLFSSERMGERSFWSQTGEQRVLPVIVAVRDEEAIAGQVSCQLARIPKRGVEGLFRLLALHCYGDRGVV